MLYNNSISIILGEKMGNSSRQTNTHYQIREWKGSKCKCYTQDSSQNWLYTEIIDSYKGVGCIPAHSSTDVCQQGPIC